MIWRVIRTKTTQPSKKRRVHLNSIQTPMNWKIPKRNLLVHLNLLRLIARATLLSFYLKWWIRRCALMICRWTKELIDKLAKIGRIICLYRLFWMRLRNVEAILAKWRLKWAPQDHNLKWTWLIKKAQATQIQPKKALITDSTLSLWMNRVFLCKILEYMCFL